MSAVDGSGKPPALRRPLTIHELRDRIEDRIRAGKPVHLTAETGWILLHALRAYTAHPSHAEVVAMICRLQTMKRLPCKPPCQRCSSTAADIRALYRGEAYPPGEGDWSGRVKCR